MHIIVAIVMLLRGARRCHHDAQPAGVALRRRSGFYRRTTTIRSHRSRRNHDLRGDALRYRSDEPRGSAAASARARRCVSPFPNNLSFWFTVVGVIQANLAGRG